MAWYPNADRSVPGSSPGSYTGGPWHLVLHTTEGSSAEGAFSAYRANDTWPHFTADEETIYQHIDTSVSASAVLNESGGVETNRLSAIQIEMVGFAGSPKSHAMLALVAELCAWLEEQHGGIPHEWPNGFPKGEGGPHNRSVENWTSRSGWYGHSQCPENVHWDPGELSDDEMAILMGGRDVKIEVNGAEQTGAIGAKMSGGNSWMDVSDWCAFAGYPKPTWSNETDTLSISTQKVRCQVVGPDGCYCPNESSVEALLALEGTDSHLRAWVCAGHGP
jgi:hypothetical protein